MVMHFCYDEISGACRFSINAEKSFVQGTPFSGVIIIGTSSEFCWFAQEKGIGNVVSAPFASSCGLAAKDHVESLGIDVLGPTHHGIFKSIYFFDPNGHRIELAADIGTPDQYSQLKSVAQDMIEEWSATKKAPRHAAWLHEKIAEES